MRAVSSVLLCLLLALQGSVAAMDLEKPCPMAQDMHAAMMDGAGMKAPGDVDDCCNDAETAARTGKLCKDGQDCSVTPVLVLVPEQNSCRLQAASTHLVTSNWFPPSFNPYDIWRPPALS